MIYYFYRANCPNCPAKRKELEDQGISFISVDCDTDKGIELARKYNVLSVPAVIEVENE